MTALVITMVIAVTVSVANIVFFYHNYVTRQENVADQDTLMTASVYLGDAVEVLDTMLPGAERHATDLINIAQDHLSKF